MIKHYITEIEIYDDEAKIKLATVIAEDEACAKVTMSCLNTVESRRELAKEIELAIEKMEFV